MNDSGMEQPQEMWAAFLKGDDGGLEKLYQLYFDQLYAYGFRYCADAVFVEDAIQDLFIKFINTRHKLTTPSSVKNYLFGSFKNLLIDKLRAEKRQSAYDSPFEFSLAIDDKVMEKEQAMLLHKKLQRAMEQLTARQREAIYLRFYENFSYQEISSILDLSPKATYKLMARAIEALRAIYKIGAAFILWTLQSAFLS
ncbi:RNA polymerase sigma factor [Pinibacter soli]|uniref:Sigma-70 family RNA polymerase sigma factor n=1 Tax=Pinibacter soli TaxID=3044211 RepID=A0ABT6RFE4_9BACT|nr:sigma-70 family RNA polymerase sigma factor [Pinibacter soli]MDI3320582.1 sigma-70 family RNA polymerase sigma factor [Pinibacter soli]